MSKTPVPGKSSAKCWADSECSHADPRDEFAYDKPLREVTARKDADASPQHKAMQDEAAGGKPLTG